MTVAVPDTSSRADFVDSHTAKTGLLRYCLYTTVTDDISSPFLPLVPRVTCACETVIVIAFQPSVNLVLNCLAQGPRLK